MVYGVKQMQQSHLTDDSNVLSFLKAAASFSLSIGLLSSDRRFFLEVILSLKCFCDVYLDGPHIQTRFGCLVSLE